MDFDRRQAARVSLILPILLEGGVTAIIRDIGPQGIFLQAPRGLSIGHQDWMRFEIALTGELELDAIGEVLRVECNNGGLGVALRLHSILLRRAGAGTRRCPPKVPKASTPKRWTPSAP